jgi:hypothetical protein
VLDNVEDVSSGSHPIEIEDDCEDEDENLLDDNLIEHNRSSVKLSRTPLLDQDDKNNEDVRV